MKRFLLLTAGLAFALAACGDDNSSDDVASSATEASASVADESAEPTDDAADASIERVVCLTGACIDGLYLLGMQPVAANDFLHFSDVYFGPDADIGPVSGSFFEPSIEDIVAAEPDLVIGIAGVHDALETSLDPIPLMIVDPIGVEGAIDTLRDIGERVGRPAEAEEAISSFEDRWATVTTSVESPRSSVILFTFDGVTVGAELLAAPAASLLDGISDYAYQVEDVQGEHSATLSLEELLELDPDVIFGSFVVFGEEPPPLAEGLAEDPVWAQLSAVQSGEVYDVAFDLWSTSRGLRALEVILEESYEALYGTEAPS